MLSVPNHTSKGTSPVDVLRDCSTPVNVSQSDSLGEYPLSIPEHFPEMQTSPLEKPLHHSMARFKT